MATRNAKIGFIATVASAMAASFLKDEARPGVDSNSPEAQVEQGKKRDWGNPPDVWGRSPQCRQMVRKNRMRRMGIKSSKI